MFYFYTPETMYVLLGYYAVVALWCLVAVLREVPAWVRALRADRADSKARAQRARQWAEEEALRAPVGERVPAGDFNRDGPYSWGGYYLS